MKLGRKKKPKHTQAADALAGVTKVWAEWQLGKKATKGVAKAKALRPPGKLKRILSLKWVKVGGAVAVAGGTAAAVGKKLKGDDPESYTGQAPSDAADVAVQAPDTPPPLTVAPDPATQERETQSVGGDTTLRANRDDSAGGVAAADTELASDAADGAERISLDDADPIVIPDDAEPAAEEPADAETK